MHDPGPLSPISYCTQLQEMYLLRTIWCSIGSLRVSRWYFSQPNKNCYYPRFTTTYISHVTKISARTYRLLQEFYERVCRDHCTYGETVEEICKVLTDGSLSRNLRQIKEQDGHCAITGISRLEEVVPHPGRRVICRARHSLDATR